MEENGDNTNAALRTSTGEFTCNGANVVQVPEISPTTPSGELTYAQKAYAKMFAQRSLMRLRGKLKRQQLQKLQAALDEEEPVQKGPDENQQSPMNDGAKPSTPQGNADGQSTGKENAKAVAGAAAAPQENGDKKAEVGPSPRRKRVFQPVDPEEIARRRKRMEEEEKKYKIGKILIGDNDYVTAREAEEELLSLLPSTVEMGVFLAEGGFGKVFMVEQTDTHETMVAKVCMHYGKEREFKLFVQEGRMQRLFDHDNICRAYSYGYGPNMAVTFLEFLKGAELFDLIPHKVGVPLNKAFDYFSQTLNGVEYLHNFGFAHLDIKPENIIVTNEGVAKLVDFGHGVMYRYKDKTRPIMGRRGTRPYMAPETLISNVAYDPLKVDIFSLGITLMTVVTGERIWKEPRSRDKIYDAWCNKRTDEVRQFRRLPPDLLSFLRGMLEPDPAARKGFAEIRQHVWFRTGQNGGLQQEPLRSADARLANRHMSASQPASSHVFSGAPEAAVATVADGGFSFSQPVSRARPPARCHLADERPERGFNPKCIMRRLTRFFSRLSAATTLERLLAAIEAQVHVKSRVRGRGDIVIESRAKMDPFTARVVLILFPNRWKRRTDDDEEGDVLVEFRRASGDEFAFLEMYHSILRTLTRMKVVDEEHPYLEILNAEHRRAVAPTHSGGCDESKEKTT